MGMNIDFLVQPSIDSIEGAGQLQVKEKTKIMEYRERENDFTLKQATLNKKFAKDFSEHQIKI